MYLHDYTYLIPSDDVSQGLKARGNVEDWLGKTEEAMFVNLRKLVKFAIGDYEQKNRKEWVLDHCSQVILTVSQIMWCRDIDEILEADGDRVEGMRSYETKCYAVSRASALSSLTTCAPVALCCTAAIILGLIRLRTYCQQDLNELAAVVRGELPKLARAVLCALITIDVHARDMVTDMVKNQVASVANFDWQKQLRLPALCIMSLLLL